NRAHTQFTRSDHGRNQSHTFFTAHHINVVDQQNRVVHHNTYQHDEAHKTLHVQCCSCCQQHRNHTHNRQWHGQHYKQRIQKALELCCHHHVNQYQRHHNGHHKIALCTLLLFVLAAVHNRKPVRKWHLSQVSANQFNRITQGHSGFQV